MRSSALLQAKNAFEILGKLPRHGMGSKLSRTSWTDDCYWTVSKVRISSDGKHGTAWGVLTWRGEAQQPDAPTQISGPLKAKWRVLHDSSSQQQWQPSELLSVLQQEQQTAAAAEAEAQPAAAEQPAA